MHRRFDRMVQEVSSQGVRTEGAKQANRYAINVRKNCKSCQDRH